MKVIRSAAPRLAALVVFALVSGAGCSPSTGSPPTTKSAPAPTTKADQAYTVRGQIAMLPDAAKPLNDLQIHHEPIPSFVNKDGKVIGMNAMVMPFTPDAGLPLKDFAVGDIVEFSFEVRWKSRPASLITKMQKLPADTKLDFGKAAPR